MLRVYFESENPNEVVEVVQTLRDKYGKEMVYGSPREEQCEYCSGTRKIIERSEKMSLKGDFYPGVDVGIDRDVLFVDGCADVYEPNYIEAEARIKFCPMCGRELKA